MMQQLSPAMHCTLIWFLKRQDPTLSSRRLLKAVKSLHTPLDIQRAQMLLAARSLATYVQCRLSYQ